MSDFTLGSSAIQMDPNVSKIIDDIERLRPPNACTMSCGQPCVPCKEMSQLFRQIIDTSRSLSGPEAKKLFDRYLALTSQMNQMHSPFIFRILPEIASHILQFCIPDAAESPSDYVATVQAVLDLSAVCRDWRYLALSTPQLWTTLPICLGTPRLLDHLDVIEDWLRRSKAMPLTIYLGDSADEYLLVERQTREVEAIYHNISRVADILKIHSGRWELLEIRLPGRFFGAFGAISHSSPILRSLSLTRTGPSKGAPTKFEFRSTNFKPSQVSLHAVSIENLGIDWSAVTHVDLGKMSSDIYFRLLQKASRLKHCTLTCLELAPGAENQTAVADIVHPVLQELEIVCPGYTFEQRDPGLQFFFGRVTFPALRKLGISLGTDKLALPVAALSSFLARSAPQLTDLHLITCRLEDDTLLRLLSEIPSLTHLDLAPDWFNDSYSPEGLFRMLSHIETEDIEDDGPKQAKLARHTFLPNLHSLTYTVNPKRPFPWKSLPEIFGPRCAWDSPLCRPLRSVWVVFYPTPSFTPVHIDDSILPSLLALIDAGIDLQVRYGHHNLLHAPCEDIQGGSQSTWA
ncbi:hypothetical protein CVT26_009953 [Gymnopilus dilepis]|uniref:Uncharacterized protein n=1 Tax=Gymnopilus dilepis TaxID=231916 RepID=A0A409VL48_9AGAR|nr:hypothetical protein CVT26_009953 [Gymnopilus dilepis]